MAKGMETWDARAQTFSLSTDATYLVNFLKQVNFPESLIRY